MNENLLLSPEFQYFGADVFANVYDGGRHIKMPQSIRILGFSNAEDPAIPQRHENYIFRREVLKDFLGNRITTLCLLLAQLAVVKRVAYVKFVLV